MRRPIAIFIIGPFGVGKTTLVNSIPHEDFDEVFTVVNGLFSPGKTRGTDSLNSMKIKKADFYENYFTKMKDKDVLFHGVFYSGMKDFVIASQTHDIVGVWLDSKPEDVKARMAMRGGKFNEDTYYSVTKTKEKKREFIRSVVKGKYYEIDASQPADKVAQEFWDIVKLNRDV